MTSDMLRGAYLYLRVGLHASHDYAVTEVARFTVKHEREENRPDAMAQHREHVEYILTPEDRSGPREAPHPNRDPRP